MFPIRCMKQYERRKDLGLATNDPTNERSSNWCRKGTEERIVGEYVCDTHVKLLFIFYWKKANAHMLWPRIGCDVFKCPIGCVEWKLPAGRHGTNSPKNGFIELSRFRYKYEDVLKYHQLSGKLRTILPWFYVLLPRQAFSSINKSCRQMSRSSAEFCTP
jgi:hypothetical protein